MCANFGVAIRERMDQHINIAEYYNVIGSEWCSVWWIICLISLPYGLVMWRDVYHELNMWSVLIGTLRVGVRSEGWLLELTLLRITGKLIRRVHKCKQLAYTCEILQLWIQSCSYWLVASRRWTGAWLTLESFAINVFPRNQVGVNGHFFII